MSTRKSEVVSKIFHCYSCILGQRCVDVTRHTGAAFLLSRASAEKSSANRWHRVTFDARSLVWLSKLFLSRLVTSRSCRSVRSKVAPLSCTESAFLLTNDEESDHPRSSPTSKKFQDSKGGGIGDNGRRRGPLKLMDYKRLIFPHPIKTLRNYFLMMLIRGYFEHEFSMNNFLDGAQQAILHVAGLISRGQFEDLEGLVTTEAIWEVRCNYYALTDEQKSSIAINQNDFIYRFIYEIGMIFDDDTDQRFVEITTVFSGHHDFENIHNKNFQDFRALSDRSFICNYRFIREFTKGKTDDWTINKLNHFCPAEEEEDKS